MAESCLLYYVADRTAFAGDDPTRRRLLLDKIAEAASAGVDYIQLREKDLPTRDLESLARESEKIIAHQRTLTTGHRPLTTTLLINSRTDVALAVKGAGVHLRSGDISPEEVRKIWKHCGAGETTRSPHQPLIGVSCHSQQEVFQAAADQATFAVFGPVFEKKDAPVTTPAGLKKLREACRAKIPVLALGGVTLENAQSCLQAGAAGIAAIRLFQESDIATIVRQLRG